MELNTFISRLFSAAEAAGIAPAEAACSQSDSFRVRVRRGELEDYQVSENAGLTLRGRVNGRIGTASTQALTEESIPLLIQGVLESAALIETDEQDDILPPDNSYASVCNDSEAVTALTAEQKIALAREIDEKLRSDDPRLTPDTCAVATGEETFTLERLQDGRVLFLVDAKSQPARFPALRPVIDLPRRALIRRFYLRALDN